MIDSIEHIQQLVYVHTDVHTTNAFKLVKHLLYHTELNKIAVAQLNRPQQIFRFTTKDIANSMQLQHCRRKHNK